MAKEAGIEILGNVEEFRFDLDSRNPVTCTGKVWLERENFDSSNGVVSGMAYWVAEIDQTRFISANSEMETILKVIAKWAGVRL